MEFRAQEFATDLRQADAIVEVASRHRVPTQDFCSNPCSRLRSRTGKRCLEGKPYPGRRLIFSTRGECTDANQLPGLDALECGETFRNYREEILHSV
jgi:hypothetical protein